MSICLSSCGLLPPVVSNSQSTASITILCLPLTTTSMSFFTASINLLFAPPPACQSQPQQPPCRPSVDCLLCLCQKHLSLAAPTLSPEHLTRSVPPMCSFLILSILVEQKLNISISAAASCLFLSAAVSQTDNTFHSSRHSYDTFFSFLLPFK